MEAQQNLNETNTEQNNTAPQSSTAQPIIESPNFSSRDRDIDAIPPLGVGPVSDLAGQASAAGMGRNDELTTGQQRLTGESSISLEALTGQQRLTGESSNSLEALRAAPLQVDEQQTPKMTLMEINLMTRNIEKYMIINFYENMLSIISHMHKGIHITVDMEELELLNDKTQRLAHVSSSPFQLNPWTYLRDSDDDDEEYNPQHGWHSSHLLTPSIKRQCDFYLLMHSVRHYDRQRPTNAGISPVRTTEDVSFMLRDVSALDEKLMLDMDDEKRTTLSDQLETIAQRNHDHELLQMNDDILQHTNDETEQIISAFETLDHSESEDNFEVYDRIQECRETFYRDLSHPSDVHGNNDSDSVDDDLLENTDTEDGADEILDLFHSNRNLTELLSQHTKDIARLRDMDVIALLDSNTHLVSLISKQRHTIARLRARINRLGHLLTQNQQPQHIDTKGTSSPNNPGPDPETSSRGYHYETSQPYHTALVLMDSLAPDPDMTLSTMSSQFDPKVHLRFLMDTKIQRELQRKQDSLQLIPGDRLSDDHLPQLWMYFDSGASRSVISPTSPIRQHLTQSRPVVGSCSIGDGTPLEYIEKGTFNNTIDTTVVQNLKYDLFSSVSAAKLGLTSIIDYDVATGKNNSYMVDKLTGNIIPLVERGQGILEVPLHLMTPRLSKDDHALASSETLLYAFDILKQLNERERDFLIHARLGHAPKRVILNMKKNGTKGLELYTGKYGELCKPCIQAKQRAENHGIGHLRHPHGLPGEHLHSDLATVSTLDSNGNKYVLTVIDEISSEVIIALLKTKTAEAVHRVSQKIQKIITARTRNKLRTWQFDRGSEFLNATFENWLKLDLGVEQRFSNIEHPWENGKAERSFQTIFVLARSLLKHADLPIRMWGKAVLHAAYIMNRTPTSITGGLAPLQYRTKEPLDLSNLRVFGSPAQIHVRATIREDKKLSDRSVTGTFIGHSTRGNGYLFLVPKSSGTCQCDELDSNDVKFNETFSPYRERQGRLISDNPITPDLIIEAEKKNQVTEGPLPNTLQPTCDYDEIDTEDGSNNKDDLQDVSPDWKAGRGRRLTAPRQFLLPGTGTSKQVAFLEPLPKPPNVEFQIRDMQYANFSLHGSSSDPTTFLMACLESQCDDDAILNKELELLMACSAMKDDIPFEPVNLTTPDPKSQRDIDNMPTADAKRFNDATLAEVNGMKQKGVMELRTLASLHHPIKIFQSVVNWTSKTNLGVYVKTKCRICFGGHRYDKSASDTFAPTVNFCTVLTMICLSAMFSWFLGSIDYSQAYLNADLDEICVMQAPVSVREYDDHGNEYYWLLKKAIYGHPKSSRLWAACLHRKLLQLGYEQFLTDQCVYGKWTNWDTAQVKGQSIPDNMSFVFLLIHSDDIIIISHRESVMNAAKSELLTAFEGTDNGLLTSFCGVEIKVTQNQISLSMEYYWNKLMDKFNVSAHETEDAPLKTKILRSECPTVPDPEIKNNYLQIIGSIIYGFTHCRLDLAFPVNMMTRVMHSPAEQHLKLLQKLLRYINSTKNWDLTYCKDTTVSYGMNFVFYFCVDSAHADDEETYRSTGGWFLFLRRGQGAVAAKSGQTTDIPLSSTESETIWGCHATMQGAFVKQFLDETKIFSHTSFELHEDSQPMINAQKRNVSQSRFKHLKTKHHYIRKMIFDGWCKLIKVPTSQNTADMATKILPAKAITIFSKVVLGLQDALYYSFSID